MPSGAWAYTVAVFKIWCRHISGPVLGVIGLALIGVQMSVGDASTASKVSIVGARATLAAAGVLIILAMYEVWRDEARKRRSLEDRISGFPIIRVADDGLRVESVNFWISQKPGEVGVVTSTSGHSPPLSSMEYFGGAPAFRQRTVSAIKLYLTNRPTVPGQESTALDTRATVAFRTPEGRMLLSMEARWADSSTPQEKTRFSDLTEILAVRLAPGQTRPIDIAFRYPEEDDCYAMNHQNYEFAGFRMPDHRLPTGTILARVEIQGRWIHSIVDLQFSNDGAGKPLRALSYDWHNVLGIAP